MNKKQFLYGTSVLALALTACSSEEPGIDNGGVLDKDVTKYLKVAISTSGAQTKATAPDYTDDFQNGEGIENTINNVVFYFYDAAGNYLASNSVAGNELTVKDGDKATVEKYAEAVVSIDLNKGQSLPSYVFCFVNPTAPMTEAELQNTSLEDLRNLYRSDYKTAAGNFAMNNSAYYGENPITGEQNVKMSGTPVIADYLYTTEDEAENGEATCDIYVERYASKVNYSLNENGIQDVTLAGGYSLSFTPKNWTVNADANKMYVVKKFSLPDNPAVPSFTEVDNVMNYFFWNDPDHFRSYWACSPGYYNTIFPNVSDNIVDNPVTEGGNNYGAGAYYEPQGADNGIKYYSYNQINAAGSTIGSTVGTPHYTLENTIGQEAMRSRNPYAAMPSALLTGQYTVKKDGTALAEGTTFYIIGTEIYFEDNNATAGTSILDHFIGKQTVIYTKDGDTYNRADAKTIFTVKHPASQVYGTRDVPEPFVTLQLTDNAANGNYYIKTGEGQYSVISNANMIAANLILWENVSNANAFTNGYAYFNLPILHLGGFDTASGIENPANLTNVNWDEVKPGAVGLVRNHVYNIVIDGITGIGTGICNPDYPIVPATKSDQYWLKYRLNIQQWRLVPTQNATFN